jgi:transglutaminase-like putative cysteine protease
MLKPLALILIIGLGLNVFAANPKYNVSGIPDELKEGMYAVIRESDNKFFIEDRSHTVQHVHLVITILNAKAKRHASLSVFYDKLTKIESLKAAVYDAEGNTIKKLKQSEFIDQSYISGFFEDDRMKYADLSQTVYPYTVEFDYVVSTRYLFTIPGFELYDDDEITTQKSSYSIIYPKELKPRYKLFKIDEPKVGTTEDKRESLTWIFENIKPIKFEEFSPDFDKVVPNIKAAPVNFEYEGYVGNMETWQEFGKWISSLNHGRNILPEATKLKIKQLTADLTTIEEKSKALYQYLQNKTRYVSIQLGIGGLQPFEASSVDQTGYGDCKALSNYMISMLDAVGVTAHYVLIRSGEYARELRGDFVSSQFDHAIVAVPNGADTLWLECTNQTNPFGYSGTFTGDRKALIITESGGKLARTTRYTANQNLQSRSADVFVEKTGDATAKVKTTFAGLQYENGNLHFYLNNQYDDQKKWLRENTSIPSFDITAFSMVNKKDKIPAAIVHVDLSLKRFATVSGKRLFLTPNLMNRSTYVPEKLETRKTNVVTRNAYTHIDTIRYHLPEGIYPEFMPSPAKVKSRFGEYEAGFTLDQDNLIYTRKVRMIKGEFPPESYTELIEFYRSVNKADNTKMVFLSKT